MILICNSGASGLVLPILSVNYWTNSPGHPWYYFTGNTPLSIENIFPHTEMTTPNFDKLVKYTLAELPKNKKSRLLKLAKILKEHRESLDERALRYEELLKSGPRKEDVMPWNDENNNHDVRMAWCTSMSLVHNHIRYAKSHILACLVIIKEMIENDESRKPKNK